jgi:GDP-L-fucose synthase
MINKQSKIFITGHKGLVGSSLYTLLKAKGYKNLIVADRYKLDLLDKKGVENFIKNKKVEIIVNCAAKVGGILANKTNPVDFFYENIMMQNNLLMSASKYNVKRIVYLGSSCIYPKQTKTPIKEDQLLTGKLEKTNEAYALAKISGIKLSEFLFYQKKLDVVCVMPTNLYGVNDNFDKYSSHVIPGMIAKFLFSKKNNKKSVELWGSGKPLREFMFNDDLSEAIHLILKSSKKKILKVTKNDFPIFNVGTGKNISIKNLAKLIKKIVNYKGQIKFNRSYPDGTRKKNLNSSRIKLLGWSPKIKLEDGIRTILNQKKI